MQLPVCAQHQRYGVIGDFVNSVAWNVSDKNSVRRRSLKINIINSHTVFHNRLAAWHC